MKIPVILDCDPGWDDTIAIIMALSNSKLDVKAITCVAGNVSVQNTTENAKKVLSFLGSNVILSKGAEAPLVCRLKTIEDIHGEDGMYGILEKSNYPVDERKAWELMRDILKTSKEKITLITTAALTNIALLIKNFPEVLDKIEKICMMGGSISEGNITEYAEFNMHTDPHAAEIVFNSGIPIIMCGLDASYKAICKKEDINKIKDIKSKKSDLVFKILVEAGNVNRDYIKAVKLELGDAPLYDLLPVAYLINPTNFVMKKCNIKVETDGERRGQTVELENNGKFNANVVVDLDREEVINILLKCLK